MWAAAKLEVGTSTALESIVARALELCDSMNSQNVSNTLFAVGRVTAAQPAAVKRLLDRMCMLQHEWKVAGVVAVLLGMQSGGYADVSAEG